MISGAESAVDVAVLRGVSAAARALAGESLDALDWLARLLVDLNVLKLGVPTVLAMYAWLRPDTGLRADPVRAVRGAAGVVLTLALARAAQELLPERPRPRVALPDFPFPPLGHLPDLADWSSMPSDTAALASALVAVAWASSRRLGAASAAWAVVMTCLPRMYMGHHYLSDLVAGALLGVLSVTVALGTPLPAAAAAAADAWLRRLDARAPAALLLGFFVLGAECLHAFESTRKVVAATSEAARAFASEDSHHAGGEAAGPAAVEEGGGGRDTAAARHGRQEAANQQP